MSTISIATKVSIPMQLVKWVSAKSRTGSCMNCAQIMFCFGKQILLKIGGWGEFNICG